MNIEAGGPGGLGSAGGGGGVGSAPIIISKTSGSFTTTGSVVAFTAPVAGVFQVNWSSATDPASNPTETGNFYTLYLSYTDIWGNVLDDQNFGDFGLPASASENIIAWLPQGGTVTWTVSYDAGAVGTVQYTVSTMQVG